MSLIPWHPEKSLVQVLAPVRVALVAVPEVKKPSLQTIVRESAPFTQLLTFSPLGYWEHSSMSKYRNESFLMQIGVGCYFKFDCYIPVHPPKLVRSARLYWDPLCPAGQTQSRKLMRPLLRHVAVPHPIVEQGLTSINRNYQKEEKGKNLGTRQSL